MYLLLYILLGAFVVAPINSDKNTAFNSEQLIASLKDVTNEILNQLDVPEDAFLNISQYLDKHGYPLETHEVVTEDGYIITLHRIPVKTRQFSKGAHLLTNPAVLFVPPMMCSSIDWVSGGSNFSLGLLLSDLDYDTWLLNPRGTRYSLRHQTFNSTQKEFWNFSFHEKGYYDTSASIDYILNITGVEKLTAIGYSEGTSALLALTSTRAEYNEKLNLISLLSPIGYMGGVTSPIPVLAVKFLNILEILPDALNFYGIPYVEWLPDLLVSVCIIDGFQEICMDALGLFMGFDSDEIDLDYMLVMMSDKPSGISFKQLFHYGQEIRADAFRQYDYGLVTNLAYYGSVEPPAYNVSAITVPVAGYYAKNDFFAAIEDVEKLMQELPTVADSYLIEYDKFSHLDFIAAIDVKSMLYDRVISVIEKYNSP